MADASIDELIAAVESIQRMQATLLAHDGLLTRLAEASAALDRRVALLEKPVKAKRPPRS